MLNSTLKRGTAAAVVIAASGLLAGLLVTAPANADPRQHTNQAVGTGSDTTQEVLNAFTGQADDDYSTPLASDAASGRTQISSWNATAPFDVTLAPGENSITCINPRAPTREMAFGLNTLS